VVNSSLTSLNDLAIEGDPRVLEIEGKPYPLVEREGSRLGIVNRIAAPCVKSIFFSTQANL
jgi:hypothetical protein